MYDDNIKVILFCEIIINLGVLFSWISWISWFTQSLEMNIQRTTVLSHYAELNIVGVYGMEVLSYETNK